MKRFLPYFIVFILGFIVCAYTLKSIYGLPVGSGKVTIDRSNPPRSAPDVVGVGNNKVATAAAMVGDYVVNIDTVGRPVMQFNPLDLFGEGGGIREVVPKGQGSGIIFSQDGYIVTNNHVASGAASLKVTLHNGKEYSARVIGTDPATDIAVIKIDTSGLPYAVFANSDTLRVGDWVMAVGSPLGYESTLTVGVVSALRRGPFNVDNRVLQLEKMIQTDAAINPGNSGGALADLNGRVVGMNTIIASNSGGSIGIGFAIPSNTIQNVANQIVKNGKIAHPYLGVTYRPYDENRRKQLEQGGSQKFPNVDGAEIVGVYPGSPADQAGLQAGDIILKINGTPVSVSRNIEPGKTSISSEVGKSKIGDVITLQVWKLADAQDHAISVRIGKMPDGFGQQQSGQP